MLSLTNIKISRIPNRVNLTFSDGSYLPFFIDDVVRLSLVKNQELDSEKLTQIISFSFTYLGKEYALRQIAISPKTETIVAQKLKIYFIRLSQKFKLFSQISSKSVIEKIIKEIKSRGLFNQSDFIAYFVNKNKSKSINEIKFLLRQKGIDPSSLNLSSKNELESIKKILSKKKINKEFMADFNLKNKLYASLFRAGFQISDIKAAIDDYLSLQ